MKKIRLLGCGAIGSVIAEHLARGGVRDLAFFDGETLELQNVARHTLAAPEVGQSKALALARRLSGIDSLACVRGFYATLPLYDRPRRADREARSVFDAGSVYIDCTADDTVFRWVSKLGREAGRLVIHIFMNAHARMLTICTSGRHAPCVKVAKKLFDDVAAGRTPFGWDEYQAGGEEIIPGAGCWQATFPAKGADIAALVGAAIPIVENFVSRAQPSCGTAVVLRRRDLTTRSDGTIDLSGGIGLVEVAWSACYR
jgi:molybdopterin/thiamine biosynthesis adenylyltransferase